MSVTIKRDKIYLSPPLRDCKKPLYEKSKELYSLEQTGAFKRTKEPWRENYMKVHVKKRPVLSVPGKNIFHST